MGFSRQEYWSGLPCPPPGHLPDPGMESESLVSPALAGSLPRAPPGREQSQTEGLPGESWMGSQGPRILEKVHVCLMCIAHVCVCGRDLQRVCDSQKFESNCYPFPRRG